LEKNEIVFLNLHRLCNFASRAQKNANSRTGSRNLQVPRAVVCTGSMKNFLPVIAAAAAPFLTGCSTLGSLVSGMAKAVGRTFTSADEPQAPPLETLPAGDSSPDAVARRGAEIAARGAVGRQEHDGSGPGLGNLRCASLIVSSSYPVA
jgi:hypothetical protein